MRTLLFIMICLASVTPPRLREAPRQRPDHAVLPRLRVSVLPRLRVSADGHFFMTEKGDPFFWLGDTGWLLLTKLTREEADRYLEDRRKKGFNIIQVMVVHGVKDVNVYGDSALTGGNLATAKLARGDNAAPGHAASAHRDYWSHLDYIVGKAAEKGIYIALVPVWGGVVKSAKPTVTQAKAYAGFLAERYKASPNIVWMNGGDIKGTDYQEIWNSIGLTLRANDPGHLITFHPRGRASSSFWFHNQGWLDFNSVQSGHRSYEQDTSRDDPRYGEDNWKYILADYKKTPAKPVLDAEPSYEKIPHGLHDTLQPRWTDKDVRRYGYWSVFAGACGYTYGDNSVMQMLRPADKGSAYGAKDPWYKAINDPGAGQMVYLEKLMLSRPYFGRIPDPSLIAEQGEKYNYLAATRGAKYAFIYTCNGRHLKINTGKIAGQKLQASWYNPRDGSSKAIGLLPNKGVLEFDPPGPITAGAGHSATGHSAARPSATGQSATGNDWVLILDTHE